MTSSNKLRLSIVEETTHGTTPASPAMLVVEAKSQGWSPNAPKVENENIRQDGRIASMVPMNRSASGRFDADLTYPTVNQGLWSLVRAVLHAAEIAAASDVLSGASNGISAGGTTIVRTAGDFTTNWRVGDIGKVTNATNTLDNRYFIVTAVTALSMTVQLVGFPGLGTVWLATDTDITVSRAARMRDSTATTERAFSVEVAWLDLQKMFVATGQVANSLRISFAMGQKTTVQVGFTGRDVAGSNMASATVGIAGATYTLPTEVPVFSPARAIHVAIAGVSYPVRSLDIEITRRATIGHSTEGGAVPDRVGMGALRVKLTWSA